MYKPISIEEISQEILDYEGYLWMSDETRPETKLLHTKLEKISDSSNPFIVEGQLYSKQKNKSYSIKYVDGKHIVIEYDLKSVPNNWVFEQKKYISNIKNDENKNSKIKIQLYWKPEIDELCENMPVLIPAAYVFTGFE